MWNGAAEILNPNPIASSPMAVSASACDPVCPPSALTIATIFVLAVAPYARATPYRKKAELKAPSKKYFTAASWLRRPPSPVKT
jgi:hypothetical protein